MVKEPICCCSARRGSLIIGWFQLITCGIALILYISLLITISINTTATDKRQVEKEKAKLCFPVEYEPNTPPLFPELCVDPETKDILIGDTKFGGPAQGLGSYAVVGIVVVIILLLVGFISGFILVVGVRQENTDKLKIWIVIQVLLLILAVVGLITNLFAGGGFGGMLRDALGIVITVVCMWIVSIHRQELWAEHLDNRSHLKVTFNLKKNKETQII